MSNDNKKLNCITIGCTHNEHRSLKIPECDVLIHTGDYSSVGSRADYTNFYNWLEEQTQCKHKIFIEGNHEIQADNGSNVRQFYQTATYKTWIEDLLARDESFKKHNIHHLHNSPIVIEGVKFWGSPYTLAFYDWAFNMNLDQLHDNWEKCPDDVDVLITHGPPLGKLDLCANGHHAGDSWLLQKVIAIKPKYHVFSHIHESNGIAYMGVDDEKRTLLINCSSLNEHYDLVNEPVKFTV